MPTSKSTRSPAFQFYPKDFIGDEEQSLMSLQEAGAYIRLMSRCWLKGSLPSDTRELAVLCGATSSQMEKMWPAISKCFNQRADGRWTHPRLEAERAKQAKFRRRQTDNAERGWQKRRQCHGNATAMPERHTSGNALQSAISDLRSSSTQKPKEQVSESVEPDSGSPPPVLIFHTIGVGGSSWSLTEAQVASWREAYPGIDVVGECRRAKAWVDAQPERRKTARGMPAFLVRWLNNQTDRGPRAVPATGTNGRGRTGPPPSGKYDGLEERD